MYATKVFRTWFAFDSKPSRMRRRQERRSFLEFLEDRTLLSDTQPPIILLERPISRDPDNPTIVSSPAIQIQVTASDQLTGNSGVREDSIRFEYRERTQGGAWSQWLPYAGFANKVETASNTTTAKTLFRALPERVYGFRVTSSDGVGNQAISDPTYAKLTIDDKIDTIFVIDGGCPFFGERLQLAVQTASMLVDLLDVGDRIGLSLTQHTHDHSTVTANTFLTLPLTEITAGSNVKAEAKAAFATAIAGHTPHVINEAILAAALEFQNQPTTHHRAIIAMTDGVHKNFPFSVQDLNSSLDPKIEIFSVGYFTGHNQGPLMDLANLRNGRYFLRPTSEDVQNMYMKIASGGTLHPVNETEGTLTQGQAVTRTFAIDPTARELVVNLNWSSGNFVDLELIAPDGTIITDGAPSDPTIYRFANTTFKQFRIESPQWGQWRARFIGAGVPTTTSYTASITTYAAGFPSFTVSEGSNAILAGDMLDLGSAAVNSVGPTLVLSIHNDGSNPLTVSDVHLPEGFRLLEIPNGAIAPDSTALVKLSLDTSRVGDFVGPALFTLADAFGASYLFSVTLKGGVNDGTPDRTPPAAPARPDLDAPTDGGLLDHDDITNHPVLLFRGSAEPNSRLRIFDGNTPLGETVVPRTGRWTYTTGALGDGEHVFFAQAIDIGGNQSPLSLGRSVIIDSVAPDVPSKPDILADSDTGSSASDDLTKATEPMLAGVAAPSGTIDLFDGPNLIATTFADSIGAWSLSVWSFAEGPHSLTVRVRDQAGNSSLPSQPLNFEIDVMAPNTPGRPDLHASRDAGTSNSDNVTNQNQLILVGTVEPTSTLEVFDGSTAMGTINVDATGTWRLETGSLPSGTHAISVMATDQAGNTSSASPGLSVLVDTFAPSQPSLDLDATSDLGDSSTDNLTSDDTPTIRGVAERDGRVELFDGPVSLGTADVNSVGAWSLTTSPLTHGLHTLTVRAMDVAGNLSALSTGLTINIDTQLPATPAGPDLDTASDTGGSTIDNITRDATPAFRGTTNSNTNVFLFEGAAQLGTARANASGAWTVTSRGLSDGTHAITVRTRDAAGNISLASTAINIVVDTAAPSAPSALSLDPASDSGFSNGDRITNDTTPDFVGIADPNALVELFEAGSSLGTTSAADAGNWIFRSATAGRSFGGGIHSIIARATDPAGNVGSTTPEFSFTIDTTPPNTPTNPDLTPASDTGASNSDNNTNDTTPSLGGTAEANLPIELFDGTNSIGTTNTDGNGAWGFTTAVLTEGSHRITAQVRDVAGNTSTTSIGLNLTIDTIAPVAASAPDLDAGSDTGNSTTDDLTNDATPSLTGTSEPGNTIRVFSGATFLGATVTGNAGTWNFTGNLPLADGVHHLTARSVDPAGNNGGTSAELVVTIDATAPTVNRFELVPGARNRIGQIVVTFAELLNPAEAGNLANYALVQQGRRPKPLPLTGAEVVGQTVTLTPAAPLSAKKLAAVMLTIGTGGTMTDFAANPLDGDGDGRAGGEFVSPLTAATVRTAAQTAVRSSFDSLLEENQLSGRLHLEDLFTGEANSRARK